jgi:hypothetical protein
MGGDCEMGRIGPIDKNSTLGPVLNSNIWLLEDKQLMGYQPFIWRVGR